MKPTPKHYDKACREYEERWKLADDILYDICNKHPGHSEFSEIYAKVFIIGRSYATQIERKIESTGKQPGESIIKLAEHYYDNRDQLQDVCNNLKKIPEPLDIGKLEKIIIEHGRIVDLTKQITKDNHAPHSFASKYLHFHCSTVPIFDNWADECLRNLCPWRDISIPFDMPVGADEIYYKYAMRFWNLYVEMRKQKKNVTVKLLDNLILWWRVD